MVAAVRPFNVDFRANTTNWSKGIDRVIKDAEKMNGTLLREVATFGQSSRQAEIHAMKVAGVSDAHIKSAESLDKHLVKLEEQAAAMRRGAQLTQKLITPMDRLQQETREYSDLLKRGAIDQQTFNRAVAASKNAFAKAGSAMNSADVRSGAFQGSLAGTASAGLLSRAFDFGKEAMFGGVFDATEFDKTRISFETMLGSAELAKQVLGDIQKFALETPFEQDSIEKAARALLGIGYAADKVFPTLRMLGNASAGSGQPIDEVAQIWAKMFAGGTVQMEELGQLQDRGLLTIKDMAESMGVEVERIRKMSEKAMIDFSDAEKALERLTSAGGRFHNLMEKQAVTTSGAWASLADQFTVTRREWTSAILEATHVSEIMNMSVKGMQLLTKGAEAAGGEDWMKKLANFSVGTAAPNAILGSQTTSLLSILSNFAPSLADINTRLDTMLAGGAGPDEQDKATRDTGKKTVDAVKEVGRILKNQKPIVLAPAGLQ